jgi:hypothetical protein
MEATIEFSPGILFPTPFDVPKRIQQLRGYLDPNNPNYQPEQQHTNIKAAIKLYGDGKIDGVKQVFIKDGKLVPEEEIYKEVLGAGMKEYGISMPKSMLMAMGLLVSTFTK